MRERRGRGVTVGTPPCSHAVQRGCTRHLRLCIAHRSRPVSGAAQGAQIAMGAGAGRCRRGAVATPKRNQPNSGALCGRRLLGKPVNVRLPPIERPRTRRNVPRPPAAAAASQIQHGALHGQLHDAPLQAAQRLIVLARHGHNKEGGADLAVTALHHLALHAHCCGVG